MTSYEEPTTSYEEPSTRLQHPTRRIPDYVADTLRKFREQEEAELAHRQKLAKLARPTEEERRALAERYESTGQARGLDEEHIRALRDIDKRRFDRVQEELTAYSDIIRDLGIRPRPPEDFNPFRPQDVDHDFWWFETNPVATGSSFHVEWQDSGLHFFGGPKEEVGKRNKKGPLLAPLATASSV